MLAMLWAQMIILGKKKFSAVPASLKEAVRETGAPPWIVR